MNDNQCFGTLPMIQRLAKYSAVIKYSILNLCELWPAVYKRARSVAILFTEEVINNCSTVDESTLAIMWTAVTCRTDRAQPHANAALQRSTVPECIVIFLPGATEHVHEGVARKRQRFVHDELITLLLFTSSLDLVLDVKSTLFEDNTSFIVPTITFPTDPVSEADVLLGDDDTSFLIKQLPYQRIAILLCCHLWDVTREDAPNVTTTCFFISSKNSRGHWT